MMAKRPGVDNNWAVTLIADAHCEFIQTTWRILCETVDHTTLAGSVFLEPLRLFLKAAQLAVRLKLRVLSKPLLDLGSCHFFLIFLKEFHKARVRLDEFPGCFDLSKRVKIFHLISTHEVRYAHSSRSAHAGRANNQSGFTPSYCFIDVLKAWLQLLLDTDFVVR